MVGTVAVPEARYVRAPPLPAADTRVAEQRPTGHIGGESERVGEGREERG